MARTKPAAQGIPFTVDKSKVMDAVADTVSLAC